MRILKFLGGTFSRLSFFKNKFLRKTLILALACLALGCISLWYANHKIISTALGKTFDNTEEVPKTKVGLLLGTSKYVKSGRLNAYFVYRVEAAIELYKSGKIERVIISGDNSRKTYDEPSDMKKELIKNGVDSNHIYLDYAGFRTFDSMVRLKEIFSQDTVTVISQKFHNERALYIAQQIQLEAYAYNAKDVSAGYGFKTNLREKFARVKVLLDFLFGTKPKFFGPKVPVN